RSGAPGVRGLRPPAQARGRPPPDAAPPGRGPPAAARLPDQHGGLAAAAHRRLVARATGAARGMHRLRRLRALLPRGGDHAQRRRGLDRLSLLQGLRDLRGRLSRPWCRLDGGGHRVSMRPPVGAVVATANEAAAYAAVLARVQAIGAYPITPQTLIVERLAEIVAGRDDVEYANLESEHSMFGYVIAAARTGVRSFT